MTLDEYLDQIENKDDRIVFYDLLKWVGSTFPNLELKMKWNQPMFLDHGTFIISFGVAKKHFSVSPEKPILDEYLDEIQKSGYTHSKMIFRIKYKDEIDYELLTKIISRCIEVKKDYNRFWL